MFNDLIPTTYAGATASAAPTGGALAHPEWLRSAHPVWRVACHRLPVRRLQPRLPHQERHPTPAPAPAPGTTPTPAPAPAPAPAPGTAPGTPASALSAWKTFYNSPAYQVPLAEGEKA
jgi:hypothetical protein